MNLSGALPSAIPAVAALPADVKSAIPALTVMLVNGGVTILIAIMILVAGWIVANWMGRWAHDLVGRSHYIDDTLKPLVYSFARYAVLAITIVAVLSQFGVQTTSLIALLGAAGLAVGLALQGTLSNVASGVMLLILRPFRVYDKIKIADAAGTVREIGLFRTDIVTDDGTYISVPNATIFSGTIINASRETTRRTNFTIEIDRAEDLDRVEKDILECLARDPRVLKAPAARIDIDTLGPISTTLSVQAWLRNNDFLANVSEIKKHVRQALQTGEVAAPVPVPPPAVAPWQPPAEPQADENRANKPN
jgi:small conductance mechanosensitive channel